MSSHTIGTDCHITLQHASINGGSEYGFLLAEGNAYGPVTDVQRSAHDKSDGTWQQNQVHQVTIMLDDGLRNPDRSVHAETRDEMYAMLLLYLQKQSHITLASQAGAFGSLGAIGTYATEHHYQGLSQVTITLQSQDAVFAPANPLIYLGSQWDGPYHWDEAYWVEG